MSVLFRATLNLSFFHIAYYVAGLIHSLTFQFTNFVDKPKFSYSFSIIFCLPYLLHSLVSNPLTKLRGMKEFRNRPMDERRREFSNGAMVERRRELAMDQWLKEGGNSAIDQWLKEGGG